MSSLLSRIAPLPVLACAFALALPGVSSAQSLKGSRSSVNRMYGQAQQHDLYFYQTSGGVRKAASAGTLVRLAESRDFRLAAVSQPYVLPATRTFVQRLAAQYRQACGERLVVTSAARPKSQRLANSTDRSVHPTGMAIDLRKPTQGRCLTWLRKTLLSLEAEGVLEATEERNPPHFHVAVFPNPYTRYVRGGGGEVKLASSSGAQREASGEAASDASRKYKVRRGDTMWGIARRNRTSVEELKLINNLRSSRIKAGQVLIIPQAQAR